MGEGGASEGGEDRGGEGEQQNRTLQLVVMLIFYLFMLLVELIRKLIFPALRII